MPHAKRIQIDFQASCNRAILDTPDAAGLKRLWIGPTADFVSKLERLVHVARERQKWDTSFYFEHECHSRGVQACAHAKGRFLSEIRVYLAADLSARH